MSTALENTQSYNESLYEDMWRKMPFSPPDRLPWWPKFKELADAAPERLEIGPGVFPRFPVKGTHVVDLSKVALEVLATKGAIPHTGLLQDLKFDEGRFDLVGMFEVLEHVPEDEALLAEIARITKKGGRLALTVPLGMKHFNAFDRYMGHARRFEPEELRSKVERAGYKLETFEIHEQSNKEPMATVYVGFMKTFPRLAAWMFRYVFVPLLGKMKIHWHDAADWDVATKDALDIGCIFVRV